VLLGISFPYADYPVSRFHFLKKMLENGKPGYQSKISHGGKGTPFRKFYVDSLKNAGAF